MNAWRYPSENSRPSTQHLPGLTTGRSSWQALMFGRSCRSLPVRFFFQRDSVQCTLNMSLGISTIVFWLTKGLPGWTWLIGNWTITLSVNFGFASLIAATVALYHPDWTPESWQLLLIFYAICLLTFVIVAYGNKILPMVDTICAAFTALSILITLICLSAKASVGRHSARDTLVRQFH